MKLLIVTQVVDEHDPVLGFFCNWLKAFSKKFESIEVICLKEGEHHLPENVQVHSLGKEKGRRSRLVYIARFRWLILRLRSKYDRVLVHMNPEYVLVGGLDWKMMGKPATLWYNHDKGGWKLNLAARLVQTVFHTSPYAASAHFKNSRPMPAGIDTELFKPAGHSRDRKNLYFQGRIAPAKRVHVLLEAVRLVHAKEKVLHLDLVGPEDVSYGTELRQRYSDLISKGVVSFLGPKRNEETPELYRTHGATINLTARGNFDKTALESMACETPVIVSSSAFAGLASPEWIVAENDPKALSQLIEGIISVSEMIYEGIGKDERNMVVQKHGLTALADRLATELA